MQLNKRPCSAPYAAPIKNGYLHIEDDGTVIHVNDVAPITNQFEVEVYEGIVCLDLLIHIVIWTFSHERTCA